MIQFLYTDHVDDSVAVFRLIIFGLIPISMNYLFGTLLTANGSMKELNIIAAVGIVINVLVNIILIPRMQACGSAVASIVTLSAVSVLQFVLAVRIIGFPLKSLPWLRCLIFLAVLVPVVALAPKVLHLHALWQMVILTVFALLLGFATGLLRIRDYRNLAA